MIRIARKACTALFEITQFLGIVCLTIAALYVWAA